LRWTGSTDNVGIAEYRIRRGGSSIANVTGITYLDSGLKANTTYTYTISAIDTSDNESGQSIQVSATTKASSTSSVVVPPATPPTGTTTPGSNGESSTSPTFSSIVGPFSFGITSSQVKLLQEMLSTDSDIYPEGITSGYYGVLTRNAVERFQCKHDIVCEGTPSTTGYGLAGPKTRERMNQIYGSITVPESTTPNDNEELIEQLNEHIKILKMQMVSILTQMTELLSKKVQDSLYK
jgi:peptidoglycan hydrolase-like protein with peptidoglycan-binding domain